MEERRPGPDRGPSGVSSVNGHSSPAGQTRSAPGEFRGRWGEPDDASGIPGGGRAVPNGISESAGKPGNLAGNHGKSLDQTDSETTRYLAAVTQLDLKYARSIVRQIVGGSFRAVAPAAGADVVAVTRWALAALRRRAQRDLVLTCLLATGVTVAVGAWTLIPIAVMAVLAVFVVAYERWVRDVRVIARQMLRGRFRAHHAPASPSRRIEKRLAAVRRQQNGNLVVFRGQSPFVGSGEAYLYDDIVVDVARGRKKNGKRQPPIPFSTPQLHEALEAALKSMDFPGIRVGQRLYVNGEHVISDPRLLPHKDGPPATDASADLLRDGCNPASEARTYVCAEIGGWKGQLVVSLFTRAVQSHGSLQVEWRFHVLPPLHTIFRLVDRRYELPVAGQIPKAMTTGVLWFVPALVTAPAMLAYHAALPFIETARTLAQSYRIRHGYAFNYGAPRSIREIAISYRRLHDFVAADWLTFIALAQHALVTSLRGFLEAHNVDMRQFTSQERFIIRNKVSKYNIEKIDAQNVAVGDKSQASGDKKKSAAR